MAGKVVVITGASAGIGAALAKQLGAAGHRLVLAARSEDALQQVARESGEALAVVTDVTRRTDVERLRDAALQHFGQVDVWINNAGRGISKNVLELSDDDLDAMMSINLKSALYGMQAIVPHFQARNAGHLLNVSSFLAKAPLASVRAAYSAAKAALNTLTANLRMDLSQTHPGIHVTSVMPGIVLTGFADNAIGGTHARPAAAPGSPFAPQTADDVAAIIAGALDKPVAELYTNPIHPEMAVRYVQDVVAFEAQLAARR